MVFAKAFVNVLDNLLITSLIFVCKMCLEDNLIIYYKHFIYLLSLSLPIGRAMLINQARCGKMVTMGWGIERMPRQELHGKEKTAESFSPHCVLIRL